MGEIMVTLVLALIIILVFVLILSTRKKVKGENNQTGIASYTCNACGQRDCICHKDDPDPPDGHDPREKSG